MKKVLYSLIIFLFVFPLFAKDNLGNDQDDKSQEKENGFVSVSKLKEFTSVVKEAFEIKQNLSRKDLKDFLIENEKTNIRQIPFLS